MGVREFEMLECVVLESGLLFILQLSMVIVEN